MNFQDSLNSSGKSKNFTKKMANKAEISPFQAHLKCNQSAEWK